MISPDTFVQTHKRHVVDVVRVALERKGIIGFIEIHDSMTLQDARAVISENVDEAPSEFMFVLDDGAPVSARQEQTQFIMAFHPCVRIRECKRTIRANSLPSAFVNAVNSPAVSNGDTTSSALSASRAEEAGGNLRRRSIVGEFDNVTSRSSVKISVYTPSGDEFTVWIAEEYTFQQLRRDSARYWNLPPTQVALVDADGCLWPEQAAVLSVMSVEDLMRHKIVLENKACYGKRQPSTAAYQDQPRQQQQLIAAQCSLRRRHSSKNSLFSASAFYPSISSPISVTTSTRDPMSSWTVPSADSRSSSSSPTHSNSVPGGPDDPVQDLWHIFTYYCMTGDSLELEYIKAHQFIRFLRDSRVLTTTFTPAMANIIYTSETKGKPQSTGRMNFDEFLSALVKIAVTRNQKQNRHLRNTEGDDAAFHRLVIECVLPLAARWPSQLWDAQTEQLRSSEVVGFVSKFLESLLDIYMFYAKSHWLNGSTGVKEFYMGYTDYQRVINDFALANLQISSVEAAQVFMAACSSSPFHDAFIVEMHEERESIDDIDVGRAMPLSRDAVSPRGGDVFSDEPSSPEPASEARFDRGSSVSSDAASDSLFNTTSSLVASIKRILLASEGVVLYAPPDVQIGRIFMSFSAFLDVLGRLGLVSAAKTINCKPVQAVKAVFHHLSRGLTRFRVMEILHNHGTTAIHSAKFYSGSVAFSNKFMDMWRYEGSPDYLTGGDSPLDDEKGSMNLSSTTGTGRTCSPARKNDRSHSITTTGSATLAASKSFPAPVSPSKRLPSSALLFDERVVSNGAGRGREALDRIVRNAFIRNAVNAGNRTKVDELAAAQPSNRESERGGASNSAHTHQSMEDSRPPDTNRSECLTREQLQASATRDGDFAADNRRTNTAGACENRPRLPQPANTSVNSDTSNTHNDVTFYRPQVGTSVASVKPFTMPNSLHPDDERALYQSILLKGGVFKKYGQWGNPHRRFVWCSKEFDGIFWRPINKKNNLSKDGILITSLLAVLPGNSHRTRYAFMKHLSDEKSLSRCLSLVAEDRRLDLEADSEATRDVWMNAIAFFMKEHRPRVWVG